MLADVPVIATETEGAKEIISEASLGLLVPLADPNALASAIVDLLADEPRRSLLSQLGRAHIADNFSIKKTVDKTEALYGQVIENR